MKLLIKLASIIMVLYIIFLSNCTSIKDGLYLNKIENYSIKFPLTWKIDKDYLNGNMMISSNEKSISAGASIAIVIYPVELSIEDYFKVITNLIRSNYKTNKNIVNYEIIEEGKVEINKETLCWIKYKSNFKDNNNIITLLYFAKNYKDNNKYFIINFSSTIDMFEKNEPIFIDIINSFRIYK